MRKTTGAGGRLRLRNGKQFNWTVAHGQMGRGGATGNKLERCVFAAPLSGHS